MFFNLFKKEKKYFTDIEKSEIIKTGKNTIENSFPVENYRNVLYYMCLDIDRSLLLTKYLKNELNKCFGKHNTTFKGEFLYYVWILEFESETYHIFTAKNKGSRIQIVGNLKDDKSVKSIRFLKKLESKIT